MNNVLPQPIRLSTASRSCWIAATIIVPFAVESLAIVIIKSRQLPGEYDWIGLALALSIGIWLYCKSTQGLHWGIRVPTLLLFGVALAYLLFGYLLLFVGMLYGHWL